MNVMIKNIILSMYVRKRHKHLQVSCHTQKVVVYGKVDLRQAQICSIVIDSRYSLVHVLIIFVFIVIYLPQVMYRFSITHITFEGDS